FLGEVAAWLGDPASWEGRNSIPLRLWEHVSLSGAALAIGVLIALPIGLAIGHTGRGARAAVAITNLGRTIPSLGWLGMVLPITLVLFERGGLGFLPALIALVALAIPPIVTNAYAGLREVDRELIDAARGMGMGERRILAAVEVPIALPVILAGIRSSAVQVVATATLAAVVAGGTLGDFILQGILNRDLPRVFGAALMVAALALATEGLFALLQRLATSPGLRAGEVGRAP
ncbi:MAG: ABC transporter permease, partial [Candidatus Limnocylindria bacterium]